VNETVAGPRQLRADLRDTPASPLLAKSLAVGAVVVLTVVNVFGAKLMGRSETLIVAIKVAILVLFAAVLPSTLPTTGGGGIIITEYSPVIVECVTNFAATERGEDLLQLRSNGSAISRPVYLRRRTCVITADTAVERQ